MNMMDDAEVGYQERPVDLDERARFVARVYTHVFGAIIAFTAIEVVLFTTGIAAMIASVAFRTSWLVILGTAGTMILAVALSALMVRASPAAR